MSAPTLDALEQVFPEVVEKMSDYFDSHDFILKLAQAHQRLYVAALAAYVGKEYPFQIVHVVFNFVGVIMKIEHDSVCAAEADDLGEQIRLVVQLSGRLDAAHPADRRAQGPSAEFGEPSDHKFGILEHFVVLCAVPHGAAEGRAEDRQAVLLRQGPDTFHRVVRPQRGVH